MSYNNTPGKCLVKNHEKYGSIYLNLNKYNKYYIRTKMNDVSNNYNIPSEYNNNANLTLNDTISIIESNNLIIKNDTPSTAIYGMGKSKISQFINIDNVKTNITDEIKGKLLGRIGNDSLFLNHSKYNDKYYLKLTSLKDNIPLNKDIDVQSLTFNSAKEIVDKHITYNNKFIGKRDDKDVVLKNGQYGLYLIHDKKLYTLPKFILDKLDTLDIKVCNYIIDYQNKIKNNSPKTNEDNNISDDNNVVNNIIPSKKSFLDAVKSN
jgi:hypothetical protein